MRGIPVLKMLDDAKGVQVVVETQTVRLHALIERTLPGMAEGWMPNVVNESQNLYEFLIQVERSCDLARNLRDLDGVRQA